MTYSDSTVCSVETVTRFDLSHGFDNSNQCCAFLHSTMSGRRRSSARSRASSRNLTDPLLSDSSADEKPPAWDSDTMGTIDLTNEGEGEEGT